ncbi:membrane protein implicated in regulation of membrane protease activity [Pullulanibacillus pueri]|uniref:DUF3311 domain-containing protein n=1 Tax=Pullulanibacillus pueri TaxID=1437324 RepID=A0A8J2ZUV2_9BACL|nr:DUF3311 domain-containing protein [Pullulanibacillus pueri]MBM7682066.1 membrane protein implicated in regulation of membrane protease activity [Pullulanibacillus pueri]GGH80109.1 hypothetical protein GCM10007096_16030 [Pullulanibacillus pueri]
MEAKNKTKKKFNYWYILLIIPFITTLWPGLYAFDHPRLFGIPFFYWYQLAMVIITAIFTAIVYIKVKDTE